MNIDKKPIYPVEAWDITELEFKKNIIIEMKQHFLYLMDI